MARIMNYGRQKIFFDILSVKNFYNTAITYVGWKIIN